MITVAGVTVPRAAIARLAQQMQADDPIVANQLGHAIDANLSELRVHYRDAERILAHLDASPMPELEPLREQLCSRPRERERMGALHVLPTFRTAPGNDESAAHA